MTADRLAYIRAVVFHRCPELSPADLASIEARSEPDLPAEIAAQVLDVIEALEMKLEEMAEAIKEP
jgi:hypothetical protein